MSIAAKCTCGSSLNGICTFSNNCPQLVTNMEKKYPIGGYAPGDYWHKACKTCGKEFTGDKRAWNCEPCGEMMAESEKKFIEKFGYEDLFDYLSHNHGLNLFQSEMSDLIDMVHKFHPRSAGPRWVKTYPGMKDGIYNMQVASKVNHAIMKGVGTVVGGEVALITFLNKTTFGKEEAQKEDVTVYYLDETGQ